MNSIRKQMDAVKSQKSEKISEQINKVRRETLSEIEKKKEEID